MTPDFILMEIYDDTIDGKKQKWNEVERSQKARHYEMRKTVGMRNTI